MNLTSQKDNGINNSILTYHQILLLPTLPAEVELAFVNLVWLITLTDQILFNFPISISEVVAKDPPPTATTLVL